MGVWSTPSQMATCRQMPPTGGIHCIGTCRPQQGSANLQQPCSQQEWISHRFMVRRIKRKRISQYDSEAVVVNQQDAPAPWQHERKPSFTSLPVWEPPVTEEWEAHVVPRFGQNWITSLQNHGYVISEVWDWGRRMLPPYGHVSWFIFFIICGKWGNSNRLKPLLCWKKL